MEVWKRIKGYPDYEVSDKGKIKSYKRGKETILKQKVNPLGYMQVNLCNNGRGVTRIVHELVAEAFLDNPNNLPEIAHIDRCTINNQASNLIYCSRDYLLFNI